MDGALHEVRDEQFETPGEEYGNGSGNFSDILILLHDFLDASLGEGHSVLASLAHNVW